MFISYDTAQYLYSIGIKTRRNLVPMGFYWKMPDGKYEAFTYPENNYPAYTLSQAIEFLSSIHITIGADPYKKTKADTRLFAPYYYHFDTMDNAFFKVYCRRTSGILKAYDTAIVEAAKSFYALKTAKKEA